MTEIGSRQWNDSAEMSEWAFMAMVMREAKDLLPMNFSPLGVAIDIADARAKSGWRTVPDDDFAPDQAAEIARLRDALSMLISMRDNHAPFGGEIYQDRVDRAWDNARSALAAKS